MIDKLVGGLIPAQFVVYAAVGSVGVAIHLLFLRAFLRDAGLPFSASQTLATAIVIAINFWLNNIFTFRERRFRGIEMIHGFPIYLVGCAIGLLTNLGVARFLPTPARSKDPMGPKGSYSRGHPSIAASRSMKHRAVGKRRSIGTNSPSARRVSYSSSAAPPNALRSPLQLVERWPIGTRPSCFPASLVTRS